MLQKLVTWLDTYREVAFDLLRIYLGVGLFVRGVLFFYDPVAITAMLPPDTPAWVASGGMLNVVALVHIVGGALIAIGFWTRIAALTQVPILFAAVFLSVAGLFSADQSFEFSTLVLFLILLVFIYGSGRWSAENSPDTPAWVASGGMLNVVALVHIVGGALIAIGFWTRIAIRAP